jgi:hypothetical protein
MMREREKSPCVIKIAPRFGNFDPFENCLSLLRVGVLTRIESFMNDNNTKGTNVSLKGLVYCSTHTTSWKMVSFLDNVVLRV